MLVKISLIFKNHKIYTTYKSTFTLIGIYNRYASISLRLEAMTLNSNLPLQIKLGDMIMQNFLLLLIVVTATIKFFILNQHQKN